jgi:hypothetical protein
MTIVFELAGKIATSTPKDIAVGDVWLCAGQSNMAGRLGTDKACRYPEGKITVDGRSLLVIRNRRP